MKAFMLSNHKLIIMALMMLVMVAGAVYADGPNLPPCPWEETGPDPLEVWIDNAVDAVVNWVCSLW